MTRCFPLIMDGSQFHWQIWLLHPRWKKFIERQHYVSILIRFSRRVPLLNKNIQRRRFLISSRYRFHFLSIRGKNALHSLLCLLSCPLYFKCNFLKATSCCLLLFLIFYCVLHQNRKLGTSSIRRNFLKNHWWSVLLIFVWRNLAISEFSFQGTWCLRSSILQLQVQSACIMTWIPLLCDTLVHAKWYSDDQERTFLFVYDVVY